jgi:hypothetical protein
MFAWTSVEFSVTCLSYAFYSIHLSWEETTAVIRRKLQQWAQGCVYSHMHDVIEYRSNVCVCACEQEKKRNHCCWMCMPEGLLHVKREEHSISSTYIHKKQLSFVFIFSICLTVSIIYLRQPWNLYDHKQIDEPCPFTVNFISRPSR